MSGSNSGQSEVVQQILSGGTQLAQEIDGYAATLANDQEKVTPAFTAVKGVLVGWVGEIVGRSLPNLPTAPSLAAGPERIDNLESWRSATCNSVCHLDGFAEMKAARVAEIVALLPNETDPGLARYSNQTLHQIAHHAVGDAWLVRDGQSSSALDQLTEEEQAEIVRRDASKRGGGIAAMLADMFGPDAEVRIVDGGSDDEPSESGPDGRR